MSDTESDHGADGGGDDNNSNIGKDVLAIILWIADLSLRFCIV